MRPPVRRTRARFYVELAAIAFAWITWAGTRTLKMLMCGCTDPAQFNRHTIQRTCTGILATILLYNVLRLLTRRRLTSVPVLLGCAGATLLAAHFNDVLDTTLDRVFYGTEPLFLLPWQYGSGTMSWFFFFCGLTVAFLLIASWFEVEAERERVACATLRAREAKLKILRYQLNPRFLFATLAAVRRVLPVDRDRADQLVTELSDFLRYSLVDEDHLEVPLGQELDTIENYLAIERIRLDGRLDTSVHATEAARAWTIPAFLIQPLVEEAVNRGLRSGGQPLRVTVSAEADERGLTVDVTNTDGPGGGALDEDGTDRPLDNVHLHLEHFFPDRHRLTVRQREGVVHATLRIRPEPAYAS